MFITILKEGIILLRIEELFSKAISLLYTNNKEKELFNVLFHFY